MKQAIKEGKIGKVRLVYAEMDDGPIYQMRPETWKSASGHPGLSKMSMRWVVHLSMPAIVLIGS